jgi:hypothetical protein
MGQEMTMNPKSTTKDTDDIHPGMMGDGTEEQNLGQVGNPAARVTEADVDEAFAGKAGKEARSFKGDDEPLAKRAKAALEERGSAIRDQVARSAQTAQAWAGEQSDAAQRVVWEKPLLVLSVSAGTALALGLAAGFLLGRITAED